MSNEKKEDEKKYDKIIIENPKGLRRPRSGVQIQYAKYNKLILENPKGFVVLALACCLLSVSGAPAPIVDPVSVAFTAAGKFI